MKCYKSFLVPVAVITCLGAGNLDAKTSAETQPSKTAVVQKFNIPVQVVSRNEIVAQNSPRKKSSRSSRSKRPSVASSDSAALTTESLPSLVVTSSTLPSLDMTTDSLSALENTSDSLTSLDMPYSTGSAVFSDPMLSSSLDLEPALLSLPAVGSETTGTDLLTRYNDADLLNDTTYTEAMNLDLETSSTAPKLFDMYEQPQTKDFLADLDRLSSSSKSVRKISLLDTICRSLQANQNLRVERIRPEITNAGIESAEGAFDTNLNASASYGSNHSSTLGPRSKDGGSSFSAERSDDIAVSRNLNYDIGVSGRTVNGTNYGLSYSGNRNETNHTYPFYTNQLNLNITQNLLKGAGAAVNLVDVWTAKNNYVSSLYQLQGTLVNLITDVQKAYWDVYLALRTLDIRKSAYQVAKAQREQTAEFVRVGRSAPLDSLAAEAEEASRLSDIINAASNLKQKELALLRLLNPENLSTGWRSLVYPSEIPVLPTEKLIPEERVRLARYYRPDLRQAQIDEANGELEVFRSENALLPQLDFFLNLGLAGRGDTYGKSIEDVSHTESHSYQMGLQLNYSLQNRQARAANRRANFQKALAAEAIRNLCQVIDVDVRTAIIEIERTKRLIYSTQVTEELRQRQLDAEMEKYRVGRSTQIEVSQAQRDYVTSQLDRVTAEVANIDAYLELYRVEGTALQRRGIKPIYIAPESGVN